MKSSNSIEAISRREFVRATSTLAATAFTHALSTPAEAVDRRAVPAGAAARHPLLTPADTFTDVSRGDPKIHALTGERLRQARLTPEDWRLEITADPRPGPANNEVASIGEPRTLAAGTALDLAALLELGRRRSVKYLKAMQCLNIPAPLGQGLWEGVPLRDVLRLCGTMRNARRIFYWGYHNNDPKQLFQSSVSYTQAMETPPGELPAFLAYRLNGEPISLIRGGPVRMIIPWAHGFKSIKWLQQIVVTNDYRANDTYAEQNNDPESHLKTAAYVDDIPPTLRAGQPVSIGGLVISGLSGLRRVEYSLRREPAPPAATRDATEEWRACSLEQPPKDWRKVLPTGIAPQGVLGFSPTTGKPLSWPLRYSTISWSATLKGLAPGKYSVRVRAVDLNDFAQPEPRPNQKTGRNALDAREFAVV